MEYSGAFLKDDAKKLLRWWKGSSCNVQMIGAQDIPSVVSRLYHEVAEGTNSNLFIDFNQKVENQIIRWTCQGICSSHVQIGSFVVAREFQKVKYTLFDLKIEIRSAEGMCTIPRGIESPEASMLKEPII